MTPLTEKEREYMQQDSRTFLGRILCDGKEIDGVLREYTQYKGSCGSSTSFKPQSLFSSYMDIEVDYCQKGLVGKKIEVQKGFNIDGVDYWHTVGTYYVTKAPEKGAKTTIEALGTISAKMGKKFVGSGYTTVSALLQRLEEVAGCTITLGEGLDDETIPDVDLSNYLYREVLGIVAGLYMGYATDSKTDGSIVINSFRNTSGELTAYLDRMSVEPEFYDETKVSGLHVVGANDTEFVIGDLQNVSLTNPLMTNEIFTKYCSNFHFYSYQPFEMEMTLGDFTVEPWDVINIVDRDGVEHKGLPCMNIKHVFDGGLKTIISAPTLDSGEDYSRPETEQKATSSYNALVSGNFGTNSGGVEPGGGGSSGGGNFAVEIFDIYGSDVTSGIGWIDNGGGQAFACINFRIPAVSTRSGTINGNLSFDTVRDLLPYKRTANTISTYITIPIFAYGSSYYSAGGLSVVATISPSLCQYSLDYSWTNNYMQEELGELFVYNSSTGQYDVLVSDVEFQAHFFWILNSVATN